MLKGGVMKQILLDCLPEEIMMAVITDGILTDFEIERVEESSLVGRVYKGIVKNVSPTLKGIFLDIGIAKNAFLRMENWPSIKKKPTIGESILVQVLKDATSTKGPLVSGVLNIPGRCAVLLENTGYIGVSKKISNENTRKQLKDIGYSLCPDGLGLIIRTVAAETAIDKVKEEISHLINTWNIIKRRAEIEKAPALLYRSSDIVVRCLREYITNKNDFIIADDQKIVKRLQHIAESEESLIKENIQYYDGITPIMQRYQVWEDIQFLYKREVQLPSGGSIVIDYTEALTAIDVNSGSFHAYGIPHEDAAYLTNREAVLEIAKQIRCRGIGGIILIDFIDMQKEQNKEKIVEQLKSAVKKDKIKTVVCGMTSLGLVEMTRKRSTYRLEQLAYSSCPLCEGHGRIASTQSIITTIHRNLKRIKKNYKRDEKIIIQCHPSIAESLESEKEQYYLKSLMHKDIHIEKKESLKREVFSVLSLSE